MVPWHSYKAILVYPSHAHPFLWQQFVQNTWDLHKPAVDLRITACVGIEKCGLSGLSLLCLYPGTSPAWRVSHPAFRRERHFLFKMNGIYRIFEAIVVSINSGMNWLHRLKAFSSRVHLVDKLDISPLFYFALFNTGGKGEDLEMLTKCSHRARTTLSLLLMWLVFSAARQHSSFHR